MPSRPFSLCRKISRSRRQVVGHQRRQADAEVHVGAFGDVARDARGHLVAGQLLHRHRCVRQAACLKPAGRGRGALRSCTTRCTKMPGVTTCFRVELAELDHLVHRRDGQLRRRRHHRAEVARRLAVDQVAPAVAALGLDQRDVGVDRRTRARACGRRSRASPCPWPARCRSRSA